MWRGLSVSLLLLIVAGCGFQVVPRSVPGALIDPGQRSISVEKDGVRVTARIHDTEVMPYRPESNVTSFWLTIENRTGRELSIPLQSIVLVADGKEQYRARPVEEVLELAKRDSSYLIPYPYVGYYYLQDKESAAFYNTFESDLPFYAQNYPQDLRGQALPQDVILPGNKLAGEVFFLVDLALKKELELRIYLPGTPPAAPADLRLPFAIEK